MLLNISNRILYGFEGGRIEDKIPDQPVMEDKSDEQDQEKGTIDIFKIVFVKFFWKCRFRDDSP